MSFVSVSNSFQGGVTVTASSKQLVGQAIQLHHLSQPSKKCCIDIPDIVSVAHIPPIEGKVVLDLEKIRDRK